MFQTFMRSESATPIAHMRMGIDCTMTPSMPRCDPKIASRLWPSSLIGLRLVMSSRRPLRNSPAIAPEIRYDVERFVLTSRRRAKRNGMLIAAATGGRFHP
ncbi:unannotated protein [freshwater metagenome]|uniref:Unannotated protein n=1 Tax=freshwater metagenome TaxID=449393 RepID=A0A6J7UMH6_9ZZZZ